MKKYLVSLCAALLLAGCGASTPASAPTAAQEAPPQATAAAAQPTLEAASGAAGEAPPQLWINMGCVEYLNCAPVLAEKSNTTIRGGETWCVVFRIGERQRSTLAYKDGEVFQTMTFDTVTPDDFRSNGCNQVADRVAQQQASAPTLAPIPTETPIAATQAVGDPLPDGALEFAECRPSSCIALISEKFSSAPPQWCVVLEQNGERQPWFFVQQEGKAPGATEGSAEGFTRKSCPAALRVLEGGG